VHYGKSSHHRFSDMGCHLYGGDPGSHRESDVMPRPPQKEAYPPSLPRLGGHSFAEMRMKEEHLKIAFWTLAVLGLALFTVHVRYRGTRWGEISGRGAWFCFVLILIITMLYVD
jgi:hypothetical protein